jgi:hypothetical protein
MVPCAPCVRGSDGESESGSKGTSNVHGVVEVGNGAKKRWTDRPLVDGLAVFDVDVDNVEALEKVKDLDARVEGVLALERIGTNTDPDHDGAADLLVSVSVGDEASDVDGRPSDPLGVQQVRNQGTHDLPSDVEFVAERPTRLLELAIGLGPRRLDPGRLRASPYGRQASGESERCTNGRTSPRAWRQRREGSWRQRWTRTSGNRP